MAVSPRFTLTAALRRGAGAVLVSSLLLAGCDAPTAVTAPRPSNTAPRVPEAGDVTPPQLTAVTVAPTVSYLASTTTLTVTAHSYDAWTGTDWMVAILVGPDGNEVARCVTSALAAGTRNDGDFSCTLQLQRSASTPAGTYAVAVGVADYNGNYRFSNAATLQAAGFSNRVTLETTAQTVNAISYSPRPVFVNSTAAFYVDVTVAASDAGIDKAVVYLLDESLQNVLSTCSSTAPIVGSRSSGTYRCTLSVANSPTAQSARYYLAVGLYDAALGYRFYGAQQLQSLGVDNRVDVRYNTLAPELLGFYFYPDSVDVRAGARDVAFDVGVSNPYRVSSFTITLTTPGGAPLTCFGNPQTVFDYDAAANAGRLRCTLHVTSDVVDGVYTVSNVQINSNSYSTATLTARGFRTRLRVTATTANETLPRPTFFQATPNPWVVMGPAATVDVRLQVRGSTAGIDRVQLWFLSPSGQELYNCANATLIGGTRTEGNYQCFFTLRNSAQLQPGTYRIAAGIWDATAGYKFYSSEQMAALGIDTRITVQVDTTAPALLGFYFSPDSVDVRTGEKIVTFDVGVSNPYHGTGVQIGLTSAEGRGLVCSNLTSGGDTPVVFNYDASTNTGTYRCTLRLPTTVSRGTYVVSSVSVGSRGYGTSYLQANGWKTVLKVVSDYF